MTTNQVLFGVALTVVLAVGSQVLAGSLRIPALIVLLPVGLTAGAMTDDIQPDHLLGAAFQPLVSLAVALILFDAGVGLDLRKPGGHTRRTVIRLVTIGVAITWGLAAFIAAPAGGHVAPGRGDARGDSGGVRPDGRGPAASAGEPRVADEVGVPGKGGRPFFAQEYR